jgi:O-6-methylguanine DNA methyltransferase
MPGSLPLPIASVEITTVLPHFSEASFIHAGFELQVLAWEKKILHLTFSPAAHCWARGWLQNRYPAATFGSSPWLQETIGAFQLLAERRQRFLLYPVFPLFLERGTSFQQKVWHLLSQIPYGEVRTYGELARELGNRGFARAVGGACRANPLALIIPCHRVIAARGLGGFNGGGAVKARLLAIEGRNSAELHCSA